METDSMEKWGQENIAPINMDTRAMDRFTQESLLGPGQSAWERMARGQQAAQRSSAMESGRRSIAGNNAMALSQLASRGGVNSGAKERLAMGNNQNMLNMSQDTLKQENLNNLQIGMQSEQQRNQNLVSANDMAGKSFGMNLEKQKLLGEGRKIDIAGRASNIEGENLFNFNKWTEDNKINENNKLADATMRDQNKSWWNKTFG